MTAHDIVIFDQDGYRCRCGRSFASTDDHETHFQLERARAALRGDREASEG